MKKINKGNMEAVTILALTFVVDSSLTTLEKSVSGLPAEFSATKLALENLEEVFKADVQKNRSRYVHE